MGRLGGMKGGGFLNNVDGTLLDYEYTDTFPGTDGPDANDPQLFAVLTVQADGATEPVQTTLRGGSLKFLEIADQHTVVNPEGNQARIWDKSDLYFLLTSVEAAGVPDGGIDATDLDRVSFKSLIGRRMRFVQAKDEERMKAREAAGKDPQRLDEKTGKKYDFTRLAVEKVYDGGSAVATPAKAAATTPARKATPASVQRGGTTARPTPARR